MLRGGCVWSQQPVCRANTQPDRHRPGFRVCESLNCCVQLSRREHPHTWPSKSGQYIVANSRLLHVQRHTHCMRTCQGAGVTRSENPPRSPHSACLSLFGAMSTTATQPPPRSRDCTGRSTCCSSGSSTPGDPCRGAPARTGSPWCRRGVRQVCGRWRKAESSNQHRVSMSAGHRWLQTKTHTSFYSPLSQPHLKPKPKRPRRPAQKSSLLSQEALRCCSVCSSEVCSCSSWCSGLVAVSQECSSLGSVVGEGASTLLSPSPPSLSELLGGVAGEAWTVVSLRSGWGDGRGAAAGCLSC